jgi:hypothetical protein
MTLKLQCSQVDRAREKFVSQRVKVAKNNSWKEGIVELVDHCVEQGVVPAVTLPAAPGYTRHLWPKTKVGGWIHKAKSGRELIYSALKFVNM